MQVSCVVNEETFDDEFLSEQIVPGTTNPTHDPSPLQAPPESACAPISGTPGCLSAHCLLVQSVEVCSFMPFPGKFLFSFTFY